MPWASSIVTTGAVRLLEDAATPPGKQPERPGPFLGRHALSGDSATPPAVNRPGQRNRIMPQASSVVTAYAIGLLQDAATPSALNRGRPGSSLRRHASSGDSATPPAIDRPGRTGIMPLASRLVRPRAVRLLGDAATPPALIRLDQHSSLGRHASSCSPSAPTAGSMHPDSKCHTTSH